MWPRDESTNHQSKAMFSPLSADVGKKWISVGREKETVKDERECQSAKINRWIKTSADVSLFTFPLLCIHLLLSLSSPFFFWHCQKAQKMLTNIVWAIPASLFALHPRKKKSATSSSPTPPLKHFVSPTLLLSFAPWVIQSLTTPTLSWGAFWPGTSLPSVPLLYFSPLYVSYSFSK